MSARALFIGGTSSNAGKSWMTTAMCAWLRRRGVRVAPFKAQNMSNHSYPCAGGGEIGRAQVVQAQACGLEPETAMNPILLKPNGNGTSQVVLDGQVWKTLSAREYYANFDMLLERVVAAYTDLASRHDVILIEGAGSVSELNLRHVDLVNLGLVRRLGVPWVLVGDIERGGVIASIVGTMELLSPEERALCRGFLINKFRGDRTLFDDGRRLIEARTGVRCLGVFPYADDLDIDAEDSLSLRQRPVAAAPSGAAIAIVQLPRLSNGTDFRLLDWADWLEAPVARQYDFVILPGSKDTLGDLEWMRERGLDGWVLAQHAGGATVIGICAGYQMLGRTVADPHGHESRRAVMPGLGLLPVHTVLSAEKVTERRRGMTRRGSLFEAYEIHLGVTSCDTPIQAFTTLDDGRDEGVVGERAIGTYLHGLLESPAVCRELFGVPPAAVAHRTNEFEALAHWFEQSAEGVEDWLSVR